MENDKKNQNTTRALPHAFKLRVLPLSRYIRLITQTTNKVTRQLWRSLENYETVKKLSMKTIFSRSFQSENTLEQKYKAFFWFIRWKTLFFFINVTRRVYLGDNAMFMNERLFGNTSVFFWGTDAPCFLSLMTKNGLTWFGDCERSQQDVCRMKVTASSLLSPAT